MKGFGMSSFARVLALVGSLALFLVLAAPAAALEQKLTAADGAASDGFGGSVAIEGDTAVVGAPSEDADRGAVSFRAQATAGPRPPS